MLKNTPQESICEYLSHPPQEQEMAWRLHGLIARAATIRFLKERSIPSHQLHAVSYENEAKQQRTGFFLVGLEAGGLWQVRLASFEPLEPPKLTQGSQERPRPQVILAGGETPFWAGGCVIKNGFDVVWVRLTPGNGIVLEDQLEHDIVLFLTNEPVGPPVKAEFYDSSHRLVGEQLVFPALADHRKQNTH